VVASGDTSDVFATAVRLRDAAHHAIARWADAD
jgi:hypothetical protein